MKGILIITQNFPPESVGRGTRIYEMAKFLKGGHNVRILAPPPTFPFTKFKKTKKIFTKEIMDGLNILRLWTYQPSKKIPTTFQNILYYVGFTTLCSIYLMIKTKNISTVIISTPPSSVLLVTLMTRLLRKQMIIDVGDLWDTAVSLGSTPKYKSLRKFMKNFEINCWKKSQYVIVNSRLVQEKIKEILGNNYSTKILYYPHHVDLLTFQKQNVKPENQLVYIGAYSHAYDFEVLLKAVKLVTTSLPDLKIQFYGGGESEQMLKNLVNSLGLTKVCKINDPVDRRKIPMILSRSKLGLIPLTISKAVQNVMPTKTIEFLACGLPVFAFGNSKELEKIIEESNGGIFLNTSDYKKIAEELKTILNDDYTLRRFSQNGRKFAEKNTGFSDLDMLIG